MQVIQNQSLPPIPPGSYQRFRGKKTGLFARFGAAPTGLKLQIAFYGLGFLACVGVLVYLFILKPMMSKAAAPPPPTAAPVAAAPALEPVQLTAIAKLTEPTPPLPPANVAPPAPIVTPDAAQAAATATWIAKINRPAIANPESYPNYFGVITYEAGCAVSNLGFTTAGLNGKPYYLYLSGLLDRDPNMQMAQIRGVVQQFKECQFPVLMVQDIFWLDQNATPAPLAYGGPLVVSGTITASQVITHKNPAAWGQQVIATPTPSYTVYIPPQKQLPDPGITPTLAPTYTPYPTYTPPATAAPAATATATPARSVNVIGQIYVTGGCEQTNLAIGVDNEFYYIILAGASLPKTGRPEDYYAMVSGVQDAACEGRAIRASAIIWYDPTPTSTPLPSPTPTPTAPPTATPGPPPPATSTGVPPTVEPTAEPTLEPASAPAAVDPTIEPK